MEEYKLIFINKLGINSNGESLYELMFSQTPSVVYGEGWHIIPISICSPMEKLPHPSTYDKTLRIAMPLDLTCAQNQSCFSMQDCIDGIVALAWEDISEYPTYPEYRLVIKFGEVYNNVREAFLKKEIELPLSLEDVNDDLSIYETVVS